MRKWLNTEFLNAAFSFEEREMIVPTHVINADNPAFGTPGGEDTSDNVFLLSIEEVLKYFPNDDERKATMVDGTKAGWLLRTPGESSDCVSFINGDGSIDGFGWPVNLSNAVRPALWIDLNPSPIHTLTDY